MFYQYNSILFDQNPVENFFKQNNFRYWKSKTMKIKDLAKESYPSVSKNDETVSNLSSISKLIYNYEKEIDDLKTKLINYAKQSDYFNKIN